MEKFKKIANFLFELSGLKKVPRNGWRNIGIKNPDSVAEHVFLTSQIAYILGKMEKVNAERSALIALFHDNGEVRTGDANLIAKLYLEVDKGEEKTCLDQLKELPVKEEIQKMYKEWKEKKTPESVVARDADQVELAVQAKCYLDLGNKMAKNWIKHTKNQLKTNSAKKLLKAIEKTKVDDWWKEVLFFYEPRKGT